MSALATTKRARPTRRARAALLAAALALGGCSGFSDEDPPLPGARVPVRAAPDPRIASPELAAAVSAIAPPALNADWPQPNATPDRAPGHLAGPTRPTQLWRVSAVSGARGDARITAAPIVSGGRVFALGASADVSAHDAASGARIWRAEIAPEGQNASDGFGGGLAEIDGRVIATTGFGEVIALSAATGEVLWRRNLGAPMRAAPAVDGGLVVAATRDNTAFGLDAATGDLRWRVSGATGGAGFLGGASPAISGPVAVLPFASGELIAVRAVDGRRLWSDALRGGRRGSAMTEIADVSGDPVMAGVAVFASNQAGLMLAIDGRSGARGWTRDIGSTSPVWVAGATLFAMSVDARLFRLAASTGETLWATDLPKWGDPEDREDLISYGGPMLAGGAVHVTSSDGRLLSFDPQTGAQLSEAPLPGGATLGPVVAGGVLYVLSDAGDLFAFR
ncbi:MAG: PQQ-binding-like beta-propeller repeat protein [Rubrimonas sp.]|uniref:PQQ-like beta-propeller repeat protein n=1 Tax=Rubrimonas sp. TaxID=2036015 RepID=UPI002FDD88ED